MIEIHDNSLRFTFPEVHAEATLDIAFQRTLRIPDDDKAYPLPPGLGNFPLRHVDDFARAVPNGWGERGGVMLPMYQSEAMWLCFSGDYPFAVTRRPHAPGNLRGRVPAPRLGFGSHQPLLRAHLQLADVDATHRRAVPDHAVVRPV